MPITAIQSRTCIRPSKRIMFTFQGKKNVPIKTVKIIDREKHTQIAVSCALVRVMQDKWKHTPPDFNGFYPRTTASSAVSVFECRKGTSTRIILLDHERQNQPGFALTLFSESRPRDNPPEIRSYSPLSRTTASPPGFPHLCPLCNLWFPASKNPVGSKPPTAHTDPQK